MAAVNINQYFVGIPFSLSASGSNPVANTLRIVGNVRDGNDQLIPQARFRCAIQLVGAGCGPVVNVTETAGAAPTRETEADWFEFEGYCDSTGGFSFDILLTGPGTARVAFDALGGRGEANVSLYQDVVIL